MKHYLPILIALFAIPLFHLQSEAQNCISTTAYGTLTASGTTFTSQTIETCNYAGEYATIDIPGAGDWTFESSVGTDYLKVTDASNVGIDSGTTPVTITTTGAITVRLHIFSNSSCATQSSCRVTSVTKAPCLSSTPYGSLTASASTFTPQTIDGCNYAGEYATVSIPSGGIWTFGTSVSTDFLIITDGSNAVLASGVQPVDYTAAGAISVRVHIFTDANCGTQSSCRTSTVTKSPCLSSTLYPSNTIPADSVFASVTNITTCNYAGEYSQVALPVEGNWEFNSSDTSDFLVITDLNNNVLASGTVPVTYGSSAMDTVRVHIFTNSNCGTENSCRTTSVTRVPCLSFTQYPAGVDTVNTTPVPLVITTCNYAGEFYEVVLIAGNTYEFTSSDTNDLFFFTDTNNAFLFTSGSPAIGNVTGTGTFTVRVHIFTSNGCGTQNSCRTSTVTCLTCPVPAAAMTAVPFVFCEGDGPSVLTATDTFALGNTYWFEGACGSTPIDSGSVTSVNPTVSTWYYVANEYNNELSVCDSVEVIVNALPVIAFSNVMDATCFGEATGSATGGSTSGTGPYSYSWSNSDTAATATSLAAGDYVLMLTDTNGCSSQDTVTIAEPTELIGSVLASSDPDCNGDATGEISVDGTGGTAPYTFVWSSGAMTGTANNLGAGPYTVTITDNNGCTETVDQTLTEPAAIVNTFTVTDATCESDNDGSIQSSVSGGTGAFTYDWSEGSTTADASDLEAGTYVLIATDANGCVFADSASVSFTFNDPIIPLADSADLCTGFSITLDAGNAGAAFNWTTSETTQSISVTTGGTYTVEVTDGNGCSSEHTVTVIEDLCVGVQDIASHTIIETYPNPVNGILNLRIKGANEGDIVVELVSLSGQQIESRNINGAGNEINEQFDLSNLSQGVYLMNFRIGSEVSSHRIIVQ